MKKTFFVFVTLVFILTACNLPSIAQLTGQTSTEPTDEVVTEQADLQEAATEAVEEAATSPVSVETQAAATPANAADAVLLFGIGMHVEPFGETAQGYPGSGKGNSDYNQEQFFKLHTGYIRTVAEIVASHDGVMTVQVQSPYTEEVILTNDPILKDLSAMGFEMALHFHEDAHLGKNSTKLGIPKWCDVMKQEINLIKIASGVNDVNYWSGGNLYPNVFEAADCAGLSVNSDWKNPQTQTTDSAMLGINPWRPAGGTDGSDFALISINDPNGPVVFLPEGKFNREDINSVKQSGGAGGDEAYFAYLEQTLMASLDNARTYRVNVFHFTIHAAEFRGDPEHPFAVVERFLTEVIDPLVASGQVQWATFSEMEEAYSEWEAANPGVDPRS